MADFLQIHFLTTYGPSNLNRDDTGRPKSVSFGGVPRLRVSSQSLKRAWRTSEVFASKLDGYIGSRTQRMGEIVFEHLLDGGLAEDAALSAAREIAGGYGKIKSESQREHKSESDRKREQYVSLQIEQLAFISPKEQAQAIALADRALAGEKIENLKPTELLSATDTAADIAMFGRMLADNPQYNREAAVQVAHAFTTHRAVSEDDYYTAIDDLKNRHEQEDAGAGFIGVQEFGAGIFYLYVCVDRGLLSRNLSEDQAVRDAALKAFIEAAATVAPGGKQASFASRARAVYVLAESGAAQPRSLAAAFIKPVGSGNQGADSIATLESFRDRIDAAYGPCAENNYTMDVENGSGNLVDLLTFAVS